MTKVIYMVMQKDDGMKITEPLVGFETHDEAVDFMHDYIIENYGTNFDMRAEGVELEIASVMLQTSKSLAK